MPEWKSEIRQRLAGLKLEPVREAEIVDELAQHLEDRYQELRAGGATREQAQQLALAELHNRQLLAQEQVLGSHVRPRPQRQASEAAEINENSQRRADGANGGLTHAYERTRSRCRATGSPIRSSESPKLLEISTARRFCGSQRWVSHCRELVQLPVAA